MQEHPCNADAAGNGGETGKDRAGLGLDGAHDLPEDGEADPCGKSDQAPAKVTGLLGVGIPVRDQVHELRRQGLTLLHGHLDGLVNPGAPAHVQILAAEDDRRDETKDNEGFKDIFGHDGVPFEIGPSMNPTNEGASSAGCRCNPFVHVFVSIDTPRARARTRGFNLRAVII